MFLHIISFLGLTFLASLGINLALNEELPITLRKTLKLFTEMVLGAIILGAILYLIN
jgi:hypothetical protein